MSPDFQQIVSSGKLISSECDNYHLIYYASGVYAGRVIGWTRRFSDGQPLEEWKPTDFGSPFDAIKAYPHLREKLLQAATGEL